MKFAQNVHSGWVLLVFMIGGLILFGTALDNGFYLDDSHQITKNSFIRSLDSIPSFFVETVKYSREPSFAAHYRPLLLSSFVLNYAVDGYNPLGYHLVNLTFHVGSSFLVFLMARSLLGSFSPALVAGLVMLCNPFNAEVVNYVTARSSVMATFFYLLSVFAYIRFRPPWQEGGTADRPAGKLWIWVSMGSFVLGMLTKEILITLPLILLLYEWVYIPSEDRPWGRLIKRIIPFLALSLLYLGVRKAVVGSIPPAAPVRDFTENVLIQFKALAATIQMLIFPVNLSLTHDILPPQSLWDIAEMGSILLFLGITAGIIWCLRTSRRDLRTVGFAMAWFYIVLLPTVLVPLNQVLQENRAYIGGVAFALIVGVVFLHVEKGNEKFQRIAWGGVGIVIVVYGIGVWERNRVWDNEMNLWKEATQKAPRSATAHFGLGTAYHHVGWLEAARDELQTAIRLDGTKAEIHSDLGGLYIDMHREDLAEKEYREALRIEPNYDLPHTNLGILYRRQGNYKTAREELEAALRIYPFDELAILNLSLVYRKQSGDDKAIRFLKYILQKNPNLPKVQLILALIYRKHGDVEAAQKVLEQAMRLDPSLKATLESDVSTPDGKSGFLK
jgi:tetratricopeptide (TPR) repeat protein